MKILKIILAFVAVLLIGLAALILYAVITDYKPGEKSVISTSQVSPVADSLEFSLITWNIGYCGLDREMDFFYDGGEQVFTPKVKSMGNLTSVISILKQNEYADFILLQEVDRKSKRGYIIDQYSSIGEYLGMHSGYFATNYDVFFVPVPPSSPMGKVYSGIATFSKYTPESSVRYSFPGKYGFPKQLFMLDRCFLVNRYPLSNGKELVLINTHNEAFDPGDIRKAQMEYLKIFITGEYRQGNYVIAGGDWNQTPPDFVPAFPANLVNTSQMAVESGFMPSDWKWVYDNKTPSNRSVTEMYDPLVTTTTVIDYFLLSPNIDVTLIMCMDLDFDFSDHNPVLMRVKFQ